MDFQHPIEAVVPGAHGKVLAAMLGTTGELNLRTVARVARVSIAQASRVLPGLVELGVIERREIPPSSLFRLVPEHVATRTLLELSNARRSVMTEMGRIAGELRPSPLSVIAFGSFARGEGDVESDIDVVMVRPADMDAEDDQWLSVLESWRTEISRFTGNAIEILDIGADEIATKLSARSQLWLDVRRDGQVVFGQPLEQLAEHIGGSRLRPGGPDRLPSPRSVRTPARRKSSPTRRPAN